MPRKLVLPQVSYPLCCAMQEWTSGSPCESLSGTHDWTAGCHGNCCQLEWVAAFLVVEPRQKFGLAAGSLALQNEVSDGLLPDGILRTALMRYHTQAWSQHACAGIWCTMVVHTIEFALFPYFQIIRCTDNLL